MDGTQFADHPDSYGVIVTHLEYIRAKQDETTTSLKSLEARLGKVENRITAIEARGDEARFIAARWGAMVAAAVSAAVGFVWSLLGGGK